MAKICACWGLALSCCLSLGKYLSTSLSRLGLFGFVAFEFLDLINGVFPSVNQCFLNYLVDFTNFSFNPGFFFTNGGWDILRHIFLL